jgi:hypothetical protein
MAVEVKKRRRMMPMMDVTFEEQGEAELNYSSGRQSQADKKCRVHTACSCRFWLSNAAEPHSHLKLGERAGSPQE